MAAAARKKALVISLTLATFSVDKKAPERHKYRMSDWSVFGSEKDKDDNFQPTKKRCTKPSASKVQEAEVISLEECFKEVCFENTDDTVSSFDVQWIVSRVKSA